MGEIETQMLRTSDATDAVLGVLLNEISKKRKAKPDLSVDDVIAYIESTRMDAHRLGSRLREEARDGDQPA